MLEKCCDAVFVLNWFHLDCVNENSKFKGSWSCPSCSMMPKMLRKLVNDFELLKSKVCREHTQSRENADLVCQINDLLSEQQNFCKARQTLLLEIDKLTAKNVSLQQDKESLEKKLSQLEKSISSDRNLPPTTVSTRSNQTLLIGNSMIRDVHSNDQQKLKVMCHRGAKQCDIKQDLTTITNRFNKIMIVVGSIDCADPNLSTAVIAEDRRQLLLEDKKHADNVTISSILPHKDGPAQLKIDEINRRTKILCRETQSEYICNDGAFKLADLSPNEAMFIRNDIHLSYRGTYKLLQNLGLTDIAEVKKSGTFNKPRNQTYPRQFQTFQNTNYAPPQIYQPSFNPRNFNQNPYRSVPVSCVWCGSTSHSASNCFTRGSRSCFRCRSTSHKACECNV